VKPHQLAPFKKGFLENGVLYIGIGEVTFLKNALHEILVVQKGMGEPTSPKNTVFIFSLGKRDGREILFFK
jgi:hypothetical protein